MEALTNVNAPFQLATAGWVLGPSHDRAAFHCDLPNNIPMSAISRNTGAVEVDPSADFPLPPSPRLVTVPALLVRLSGPAIWVGG